MILDDRTLDTLFPYSNRTLDLTLLELYSHSTSMIVDHIISMIFREALSYTL